MTNIPNPPELTWGVLRDGMLASNRSDAGRAAGVWALETLESLLGDPWLEKSAAENGYIINLLMSSDFHATAYAEVLDLALHLRVPRDVPGAGKIRKELRSNARLNRLVHARVQLEVGALSTAKARASSSKTKHQDDPLT